MPARSACTFDDVLYAPGREFRVTAPGISLTGWVPSPRSAASDGWRQNLEPGDIITCTGYGPGMGADPGYGIEFTSAAAEAASAFHCEIRPMAGGMFSYRPPAGTLEPTGT